MIHPDQDRGGVRASAGKACRNGNVLLQFDKYAARDTEFLHQHLRGLAGVVALIRREIAQVCLHPHAGGSGFGQADAVEQAHGLHDHSEIVVAVRALSNDVKTQVDFGHGFQMDRCHVAFSSSLQPLLLQKPGSLTSCGTS